MANALYNAGRQKFLEGGIAFASDTIKAQLVDTNGGTPYTFSQSHANFSDVPSGSRIGTAVALSGKTTTDGIADASDTTFTSVTSGSTAEAVVIYKDTGTESTSTLIAYLDTATGLPVTTNGGDIIIQWDNGSNKIFKL